MQPTRTVSDILALLLAVILIALTMLPLSGCAGFQLGSVVYCAKDDACDVAITKPKAAQAAATPAAPAASR